MITDTLNGYQIRVHWGPPGAVPWDIAKDGREVEHGVAFSEGEAYMRACTACDRLPVDHAVPMEE